MELKKISISIPPTWFMLLGFVLSYITFATAKSIECGIFRDLGFAVTGALFMLALFQLVTKFIVLGDSVK